MGFSQQHADAVCNFFELLLKHSADEWYGRPFILAPWQEEALSEIFGNVDDDGNRRIQLAYLEVPKKSGKTEFAAGILLYCAKPLDYVACKDRCDLCRRSAYTRVRLPEGRRKDVAPHSQQSNTEELEVNSYTPHSPPGNGNGKAPTEEDYVALWEAYPAHRRKSLNLVFEALRQLHPTRELIGQMLEALALLRDSDQWRERNGQFVPSITNWINSRGWESISIERNELRPEPAGSDPAPPKGMMWKRDARGELIHPLTAEPRDDEA